MGNEAKGFNHAEVSVRPCWSYLTAEQREAHRARELARWREKNKDRMRAQHRAWRAKNRESVAARQRRYRQDPEFRRRINAQKATTKYKAVRREYLNRPEVRKRNRALAKIRRERNPRDTEASLTNCLRVLINRALKRRYDNKSWRQFIDYTVAELRAHLEKQFLPGMTWANRGSAWHIDHIIPVAQLRGDIRACWALTNLRPLWASDNMLKSDKRVFLL